MTAITKAFVGADIHDGTKIHTDMALAVSSTGLSVAAPASLPVGCPVETLTGGLIAPGFVDLQVNGGGGVMFNDDQSVEALATIAAAHRSTGTDVILPTLITDTPDRTRAAIAAVASAMDQGIEGIAGLHLEGPHLSIARKGAHDPKLIRKMDDEDLALLLAAADKIGNLMVTVAPENTSVEQISAMARAGIVVSLGHSDADAEASHAAFDAGARCVTHLFNAMSQLGNREPGLVGATLEREEIYAGLIADGIHVTPATIRIALAAKPAPERVFLVTDAMATAGSPIQSFMLNGREVFRKNRRLTLAEGTLAGADLEIAQALLVMTSDGCDTAEMAIARATSVPTQLLREPKGLGHLGDGARRALYFEDGLMNPVPLSL